MGPSAAIWPRNQRWRRVIEAHGTCQGRHERPARARASARTARHTGRRRSHLATGPGHLHRAEPEPEAACTRAQSAGERRVTVENENEEG